MVTPPRHAISFLAETAKLAARHGLRDGAAKAAAKANPALLVIEAAFSVAEAVNSYLVLREAREQRDGLRRLLPLEEDRLRATQETLRIEIELAKSELGRRQDIQQRLGGLSLICASACGQIWSEIHAIRTAELPALNEFDKKLDDLQRTWNQFRRALAHYSDTITAGDEDAR